MDAALQNLIIDKHATFKSYVRFDMARVSLTLKDGTKIEASGKSYDSALSKLLNKMSSETVADRKAARRSKRKMVEAFLDEAYEIENDSLSVPSE